MSVQGGAFPASDAFIAEIRTEFPSFRLVDKRGSTLSSIIDVLLRVVTLGGQRRYLTHYHTVLGYTLYVPSSWQSLPDIDRVILLRHERVHLRQRRRYGMLGMTILYLLPVLPLGLAYGRARLEWEAYVETLRATAEHYGIDSVADPTYRKAIVSRFTGPDYGWMWPFPSVVNRWYDRELSALAGAEGGLDTLDRVGSAPTPGRPTTAATPDSQRK